MNAKEELTKLLMESYDRGVKDATEAGLAALEKAVLAEREACAKLCDSTIHDTYIEGYTGHRHSARRECAAAIRARGQA